MLNVKELKEEDLEKVTGGDRGGKGYIIDINRNQDTTPTSTTIYDSNMADSCANPLIPHDTVKNGYCKYCKCNRNLLFTYVGDGYSDKYPNGKECNVWVCNTCNGENFYSQINGELI